MSEGEACTSTQIGLHAVMNVLGTPSQKEVENQAAEFSEEFGIGLDNRIERFGIDMTDQQARVMEGVLHGFSRTSYQGNIESKSKSELASEKYGGKLPDTYRYIDHIPQLRATQSEILEWSGINIKSIEAWGRAVKAFKQLGQKQYCFFYDRLVIDDNGNPVKDLNTGRLKKEKVVAVDTLFTIKEIRDSSERLKYYEITPSAIFLDQRESYFILVPNNWREEVRELYGNRKASSYTFVFLLFLRYQYEMKRRKSEKKPYTIRWSPEQISEAINISESTYKKRKKRANQILEDAYCVAKKIGYLSDYERLENLDILTLNENKFHDPANSSSVLRSPKRGTANDVQSIPIESEESLEAFNYFHKCRVHLDKGHEVPNGKLRIRDINIFADLLKKRELSQIKKLLSWSVKDSYWSSRLSTPRRVRESFGEAISAMNLQAGSVFPESIKRNLEIAKQAKRKLMPTINGTYIEVLSSYIEIGNGVHQPNCIEYGSSNFKDELTASLRKWKFILKKEFSESKT